MTSVLRFFTCCALLALGNAYIFGVPGQDATFDYVVVGGGTAGLAIAMRLAQAFKSVAVIEAGGFYEADNGNISVVPSLDIIGAGWSPDDLNPKVDWGFVTVPQAGLNDREMHYARGKTLGGCSARNYFTYQRPTRDSLDEWASQVGDDSYRYDAFLPYFKKSVNSTPPQNHLRPANASVPYNSRAFQLGAGPLHVSVAIWANAFSSFVQAGWQALGIPPITDFVSGSLIGVQYCMNTINPERQTRDSSQSSFLESSNRKVTVYNNTLANKIIFNGKRATRVALDSYTLCARHEIILSAGAFQSPQLLMLSGIGPKDTLKRFNIPVVSNLAGVGQNMQDHYLFGASYQVDVLTHSVLGNNATYANAATEEYLENGHGIIGNPGGELIAWEKVPDAYRANFSSSTSRSLQQFPPDWPEVEYLLVDAYSGNNENYIQGAPRTPYMYSSVSAAIVAPQSRGNVTLSSRNASDLPIINPNLLTHPADQQLALAAFKRLRDMMDTPNVKAHWVEEVVPGRNTTSDADIMNVIRQSGIQLFHASATCKMGTRDDSSAVVDAKARVFGTHGLRVVDASALPFLPPGHPQSVIYALAEKISDDILGRGLPRRRNYA